MPIGGGRRMSKRPSQAPRLSIAIMAGEDVSDSKRDSVREFFANHTKTLVTLLMILGTVLCIVLIVMVHKWRYDSNRATEIESCLDVAVVGAGLSGSYASWRMRHDSLSKIRLYEYSDRVGGRLYTHRLAEYRVAADRAPEQSLRAELGALYYLPQRQPLLNHTIRVLKLTPKEFYRPSQDLPTYYFRDRHMKTMELKGHSGKPPLYHLGYEERAKTPLELKRYYTELYLDGIHSDPLSVKYKDYVNLYELGYRAFLDDVASREGFNYMFDGSPWRSHVSNGNAALLASLGLDTWDDQFDLAEGWDSLPGAMVRQFEDSSEGHDVFLNHRLACVHKEDGFYRLIFQTTDSRNGDKESHRVCTRRLILAVSPAALRDIKFTGFRDPDTDSEIAPDYPADLVSQFLEPVPAMSAYMLFNQSWWVGLTPEHEDVVTDLPCRRQRYAGSGRKATQDLNTTSDDPGATRFTYGHLFMVASPDMDDVSYFDPLIQAFQHNAVINTECNLTLQSLAGLKHQMAKLQGHVDPAGIPEPVRAILKDWREQPYGGGWHMWRVGVDWERAARRLRHFLPQEEIYLVGSDVCPGSCQFWAEGALKTVENLFADFNSTKIFQKAAVAPLEDLLVNSVKFEPFTEL